MEQIKDWLIRSIQEHDKLQEIIHELAQRLRAQGILVDRLFIGHHFLHPLFLNTLYQWTSSTQETSFRVIQKVETRQNMLKNSPVAFMAKTNRPLHKKLIGEDTGFGLINDLQDEGFTDYILYPIPRKKQSEQQFPFYAFSIATQAPGGFPEDVMDSLKDFEMHLSLVLEYHRLMMEQDMLANCYIGHRAGKRVLKGQIRLGDTETIEAFVWLCDLRSFTELSDTYASSVILEMLNSYFEVVVSEIQAADGEVLKYIGDAILAIFERGSSPQDQAQRIVQAAQNTQRRIQALNVQRRANNQPIIEIGIGLHYGEVAYGNIGTTDRLDFTVIGSAVNHCSRIEAQCKPLNNNILCSSVFAKLHHNLEALAEVSLKGIQNPQWIFRPRST